MDDYVRHAPMRAMKNRKELTDRCSCYHCLAEFDVEEIKEWTDQGETAICPHCNIDSVLPISDAELLKNIQTYWMA
jgi:hypothetical protein